MMRFNRIFGAATILLACSVTPAVHGVPGQAARRSLSRLEQLVEAQIIAIHAYQISLAKKTGKGDRDCYAPGALSQAELDTIVAHQASLLKEDIVQILAWVKREPSKFNPSKDLEPILASPLKLQPKLPVNVLTDYLSTATKADRASIRAVASLYQCCFEVDRDGTLLWDLMDFYIALGLPTYVGQFGASGGDEDFLGVGEKLAPLSCDSPFEDNATTPFAWQICARKIWNWGEKNLHVRDQYVMAKELLAEPDIRVLIPRIKMMTLGKIAVIGHSFTMQSHWSSPGSFASVTGAALAMTNPKAQYRQWASGGLTASRALQNFYPDVLAWKPDMVLFAVAMRSDQDLSDLKAMCRGFAVSGSRICIFDNLRDPSEDSVRNQIDSEIAKETGLIIIEVGQLLAAAPDRSKFLCLDKIHMTEPYHHLMAREWLKFIAGGRESRLP